MVQLNDPDPLRWFLIYALAAACSGAALFGRRPRLAARLIALWALAWALLWIPHLEPASASELFGSPKMLRPGVEFDREFGGLLLVFFGMLPVALAPKSKD